MSMYESAERINNDLKQIFESSYYKEFTIEQREYILNVMLRFGAVAKFRCRSNVAYDNFVNACLRDIATAKRIKEHENSEFEVLRAELLPMTEYKDFLYKRGLEDIKTSFLDYVAWVKSGKKLMKEQGYDPQTIDWASYSDDISLEDWLWNEYALRLKALPEQVKDSEGAIEKAQIDEFSKNNEVVKEYNNKTIESPTEAEVYFLPIKRVISKLVQGFSNFVIIKGRAGLGKSYNIERYLKELEANYTEVTHITEAYLYRVLYENREGKIIWFKDFSALLRSLRGIEELKAATDSKEEKLITNYNYSQEQLDLPKEFVFKGKILIDCNNIEPKFKEDMDALISRAGNNFVDFVMDFETIKNLMFVLCTNESQREVTQFLIDNYEFVQFNEMNLRTQYHCFKTYEFCQANNLDWKKELQQELRNNKSKVRSLVYTIAGNKTIKSTELKKYLIRLGYCSTLRTADRRINEWVELGEVYKYSTNVYNFEISLNPIEIATNSTKLEVQNEA